MPPTSQLSYSQLTGTLRIPNDRWQAAYSNDLLLDDEPLRQPIPMSPMPASMRDDSTTQPLAVRTSDGESTSSSPPPSSDSSGGSAVSPVVPALIAVAIFVLSTLVVLKAVRSLRGGGVSPSFKASPEDEKPQLWEVSLDEKAASPTTAEHWEQIMPVSVDYWPTDPETLRAHARSLSIPAPAATHTSRSPSRDSRRSSRSSWSLFPEKLAAQSASADDDTGHLRVAVLIAMPTPARDKTTPSDTPAAPSPAYLGLAEA
ncbi:hypothetical protein C8Q70DRAFT_228874 [Cubamyces menziesii]|uniref:Uncharacterized protein n=1 Tax=Trametes cubensis TaxID=1111947 RepID=A0AAD7TTD4_9APHY|nr:hypothetical protein C8Q70DRAFT_228874 [Cubamyces menziesii]KAJ8481624.1 hypothetical protein ONZ51_g5870 [Trametes cubensis]